MERMVVWPANIDSNKSRADGRKVAERYAVASPTLREIADAAERLGLNPKVERDKAYPKEWWEVSGRVVVDKAKPRSVILREIAAEIRRMRSGK
ncbi:MAG: signal recognition particle protein Srp19 [Euryarchaeota archaeon]|nr:signal recognition particle protein Srp19 [Euryarchaeota archaeon]